MSAGNGKRAKPWRSSRLSENFTSEGTPDTAHQNMMTNASQGLMTKKELLAWRCHDYGTAYFKIWISSFKCFKYLLSPSACTGSRLPVLMRTEENTAPAVKLTARHSSLTRVRALSAHALRWVIHSTFNWMTQPCFIRNNLHNGVVSGAARGQALLGPMWPRAGGQCPFHPQVLVARKLDDPRQGSCPDSDLCRQAVRYASGASSSPRRRRGFFHSSCQKAYFKIWIEIYWKFQ